MKTLVLLLSLCCCQPAVAFLGFSFGSVETVWNLCLGQADGMTCTCPGDLLQAYHVGLDCSGLNIGHLNDGVVVPLRFTKVDLSNNQLKNITQSTFASNNTQVTNLILAANLLWGIPSDTFCNLPNLTSLDLSNNELSIITRDSFNCIPKLTELDLSHNHLKTLEADMFSLVPALTQLKLKYNAVKSLPDTLFAGLAKLKSLDMTHLQLSTLHYDVFNDTLSLEELNLAFNDMEMVPTKALFKLSDSLQTLDLSGNFFTELKSCSIYRMEHLHELYLEQLIYLRSIDDFAICESYNVRTIKLQLLPRIQFISSLAFSSNHAGLLRQIPVQDLTLSYTRLEKLPRNLVNWTNLKYLELKHNQWRCDCDFAWVKGSTIEELVGDTFYCSSPSRLHGAPLSFLDPTDFTCTPSTDLPDRRQWTVLALLLTIGMVASIVTVSVLFYRRHGFLCRRHDDYDKLSAVSRESITVVDTTSIADTEINCS